MTTSEKKEDTTKRKWEGDELNRIESAEFLTRYLNNLYSENSEDIYLDNFVLNLNAEWGFGKSFFIRNWSNDLKSADHPVVYFDAWKNDFSNDPLLAFIAELQESLKEYSKNIPKGKILVQSTLKAAKHAIAPTLGILLNAASKKITGESLDNITAALSGEKISALVDESIKSHNDKKEAIEDFKKSLVSLIIAFQESQSFSLPMYIFIDELDRCKPTYAIELLEGIKHIFGVKGIYFIIATNKSQLVHSISAVYGNNFDANGYLKRFFDQEYALPKPDNESFTKYLVKEYRLGSSSNFYTPIKAGTSDMQDNVIKTLSLLTNAFHLSLRDQKQVFRQFKAIVLSSKLKLIHILYLMFLIMFKQKHEQEFNQFIETLDTEESKRVLAQILDSKITFDGYSHNNERNHSPTKSQIQLIRVIEKYKSYDQKNAIAIEQSSHSGTLAEIQNKLREEHPSNYYPDRFYELSISSYAQLVCQAGQLLE